MLTVSVQTAGKTSRVWLSRWTPGSRYPERLVSFYMPRTPTSSGRQVLIEGLEELLQQLRDESRWKLP